MFLSGRWTEQFWLNLRFSSGCKFLFYVTPVYGFRFWYIFVIINAVSYIYFIGLQVFDSIPYYRLHQFISFYLRTRYSLNYGKYIQHIVWVYPKCIKIWKLANWCCIYSLLFNLYLVLNLKFVNWWEASQNSGNWAEN